MEPHSYRVAAVQARPVLFDLDAGVAKAVALIEEAARAGAALVAFPETWLTGYPVWIFATLGWEDPLSKRAFRLLQENALTVPGPGTHSLCDAARRCRVEVIIGVHERDRDYSRGTLYNSQVFIGSDGELRGVHRKLMPTHAERIIWGQGDGSTLTVHETELGRVGGLICWEHWMPLARFAMHAQGEQVHVAAWPELPEMHHIASRHYAFEGRCYVVCAGSYLLRSDVPENSGLRDALPDFEFGESAEEILPGGSGVIGPDGKWVAGPESGRETIVYGEVDLARVAEEQQALDSAGHYNRPDVFAMTVDRRPRPQVTWLDAPARADAHSIRSSAGDRTDGHTVDGRVGARGEA
jgi:predicted amidohydrolase